MTTTAPAGAVSTKCAAGRGASVSDASTIWTVYAGPQRRELAFVGEYICMSGMCPPCGAPSLMSASESSQVEKPASLAWMMSLAEDIARRVR